MQPCIKRLHMFLCTLRLLQSLTYGDKLKCFQFCGNLKFANLQEEDGFLEKLIYGDESPFHISGKVNKYNVRIWGCANPRAVIEHE